MIKDKFAGANNGKRVFLSVDNMPQLIIFSVVIAVILALVFAIATRNTIDQKSLTKTIETALDSFQTPGMAVGIVHKDEIILSKGYGFANIDTKAKVTPQTYFRLASTSKAFTSAALAILVDNEMLKWDDKVTDYLPDFQLQDPYVTREFTILDLLTHRSGLVSGAGDSMIWPEPSGFTRQEVIHNLRYLTPEYSFRDQYAYSNVMYITAGEIVAKVSGISFDNFVEQQIFTPLDMDCFVGDIPKVNLNDVAMSYGHNDERGIYPIPRNSITQHSQMSAAAGGIVCNVEDMLKWLSALLTPESLPFSQQQLLEMWSAHTILEVSNQDREWDSTIFKNYGLGWRIANIGELKVISHTGTLSGYQAYVLLIPKLELGVVILNNGSNSAARGSVMQTIIKAFIGKAGYMPKGQQSEDWIDKYVAYLDEREEAYLAKYIAPVASAPMSITQAQIEGEYTDQWFGSFIVSKQEDTTNKSSKLRIMSTRMSTLKGTLLPFQDATYKIEWDNKNAANDAFMHFELNESLEVVAATLYPFSVKEMTNHEYRDMHFVKQTLVE